MFFFNLKSTSLMVDKIKLYMMQQSSKFYPQSPITSEKITKHFVNQYFEFLNLKRQSWLLQV